MVLSTQNVEQEMLIIFKSTDMQPCICIPYFICEWLRPKHCDHTLCIATLTCFLSKVSTSCTSSLFLRDQPSVINSSLQTSAGLNFVSKHWSIHQTSFDQSYEWYSTCNGWPVIDFLHERDLCFGPNINFKHLAAKRRKLKLCDTC